MTNRAQSEGRKFRTLRQVTCRGRQTLLVAAPAKGRQRRPCAASADLAGARRHPFSERKVCSGDDSKTTGRFGLLRRATSRQGGRLPSVTRAQVSPHWSSPGGLIRVKSPPYLAPPGTRGPLKSGRARSCRRASANRFEGGIGPT